eukprot:1148063-Pelagomonas_calceolata.AAC.1
MEETYSSLRQCVSFPLIDIGKLTKINEKKGKAPGPALGFPVSGTLLLAWSVGYFAIASAHSLPAMPARDFTL